MEKMRKRYLKETVEKDLSDRMVFVGGPRQVGKTTFALSFLSESTEKHPGYLNWDNPKIRRLLLKGELPAGESCIILDEIHKFARWRDLVKGLYDVYRSDASFLVSGLLP